MSSYEDGGSQNVTFVEECLSSHHAKPEKRHDCLSDDSIFQVILASQQLDVDQSKISEVHHHHHHHQQQLSECSIV